MFGASKKVIVWDACRAHISMQLKEHCARRNITQVVIPGGMTPYLQCGDIALYKGFKDKLSDAIEAWKHSKEVSYTKSGNPRQPSDDTVAKIGRAHV